MQRLTKIFNISLWLIGFFVLICLHSTNVYAQQIPHFIKYHGDGKKILEEIEKEGKEKDKGKEKDLYTLTFRIYNLETNGVALWKETHLNVPINKKEKFEVLLGSFTPLDLRFDEDYWLSIEIDNKGEIEPRERMTSFGYAYMSEDSYKLGGRYADDFALFGHSHIGEDVVGPVAEAINADTVDGLHAHQIGGVKDHGELLGLADDDHLQYLNNGRGDERYAGLSWDGLTRLETAQSHIADKNNPHIVTLEQLGHLDNNPEEEAPTATERGEPTGTEIQGWADDIVTWGHTGKVTNLNADMVDGLHATISTNPQPNTLIALDDKSKFPSSVIPPVDGLWTDAGTYIYPNNVGNNFQITDTGNLAVPDNIGIGMGDIMKDVSSEVEGMRALFIRYNNIIGQFQVDEDSVGVQSITNHPLHFRTNDITRVAIDTSGKVGIGTANPQNRLHVVGGLGLQGDNPPGSGENPGGTWNFRVNADGQFLVNANTPAPGGDPIMVMDDNSGNVVIGIKDGDKGRVGIGTTGPGTKLHVVGSIRIDGDEGGDINTVTLTDTVLPGGTGSDARTVMTRMNDPTITNPVVVKWLKVYIGTEVYYMPLFQQQ